MFNKLFNKCDHDYEFVRNIHGDEINMRDGKRSVWQCKKCGHVQYRDQLHKNFKDELKELTTNQINKDYDNWINDKKVTLDEIKQHCKDNANKGLSFATYMLFIDNNTNDEKYYNRYFKELGLHVELEIWDGHKYEINKYKLKLTW